MRGFIALFQLPDGREVMAQCLDDQILLHSASDAEDFDEGEPEKDRRSPLRPGTLGVFDLSSKKWKQVVPVAAEVGTMFVVYKSHGLGVYDHPKLVEIKSGAVIQKWPELCFAVVQSEQIKVIAIPERK